MTRVKDLPAFVERSVPILTLMQTSEFIRNIFSLQSEKDMEQPMLKKSITVAGKVYGKAKNKGKKDKEEDEPEENVWKPANKEVLSGIGGIGNPLLIKKISEFEQSKLSEIMDYNKAAGN